MPDPQYDSMLAMIQRIEEQEERIRALTAEVEEKESTLAAVVANMTLRIYNTQSRSVEPFETIEPGVVRMYVCGVTPYAKAHIGHAMSSIVFDVIRRYLEYRGYDVRHVPELHRHRRQDHRPRATARASSPTR